MFLQRARLSSSRERREAMARTQVWDVEGREGNGKAVPNREFTLHKRPKCCHERRLNSRPDPAPPGNANTDMGGEDAEGPAKARCGERVSLHALAG